MDVERMRVLDVMVKNVVVVQTGTTIAELSRILTQHGISGVPVVDEEGRLCGIVSEKDIIANQVLREQRVLPEAELFDLLTTRLPDPEERELAGQFVMVEEIMTHNVITVCPDTPLTEAAALMVKHRIHRLPVLSGEKIVGILTAFDLIKAIAGQTPRR